MAITWIDNGVTFSSSPQWIRRVGFEETGRTSTTATVKVYLELKINHSSSSSFYGYPMSWTVGGTSAGSIKGSEKWYGGQSYRQFTYTYKKSGLTASGGSFNLAVAVSSSSGGNASFSKTYSVSYSTFNTAPTWSSSARITLRENSSTGRVITSEIEGTENSVKFAENISKLHISWSKATDADNNIARYELYTQIDNGAWSRIYSGTALEFTHSIGSGSGTQGKMYDYYVVAVDKLGATSPNLHVLQAQKNALTPATLTVSNAIWYASDDTTVTFKGASNSNGNTSFTYKLSSPQITIHNPTITTTPTAVTILREGQTAPSTPYILFNDLMKLTQGSGWKGNFTMELTTTNSYGSSAKKTYGVNVDLRTNPKAPTVMSVKGTVSVKGVETFISGQTTAQLSWSGASDLLGGSLTYDVQYNLNSQGWSTAVSNTSSTSASVSIPSVTEASAILFRVIAKTNFGYSANKDSASRTVHFYNSPTISFKEPVRASNSFSVTVTSGVSTSIPNVNITSRSFKGLSGTNKTFSKSPETIVDTGLTDSSSYDLVVMVSDDSGLSGSTSTATIKVTASIPVFSIREKGVGVNCVNDGSGDNKLKVNGKSQFNDFAEFTKGIGVNCVNDGSGSVKLRVNGKARFNDTIHVFNDSAVVSGALWTGTGGFVIQSTNVNTTLNFGTANSSDMVFYNSEILVDKKFRTKKEIVVDTPTSTSQALTINTSKDGNGMGSGNTVLGYNSNGKYSHYLKGAGITHIETLQGLKIVNGGLDMSGLDIKETKTLYLKENASVTVNKGWACLRSASDAEIYLQGLETRVTKPLTTGTFRPIKASAFTVNSTGTAKTNIKAIQNDKDVDSLQLLKDTNVYTYHLTDELESRIYDQKKIGFIAEATPPVLKSGNGIDLYSMTSTLWDVCKKQQEQIESQEQQIKELWEMINVLCQDK